MKINWEPFFVLNKRRRCLASNQQHIQVDKKLNNSKSPTPAKHKLSTLNNIEKLHLIFHWQTIQVGIYVKKEIQLSLLN